MARQPAASLNNNRSTDVVAFYEILSHLLDRVRGPYRLKDCSGRLQFPARGVYFVYEGGEARSDTGSGTRVVRVGTHAIKSDARTTLWQRLSQHRGAASTGRGNHRGSIFRLLVGDAIIRRDGLRIESWGRGSDVRTAAAALSLTRQVVGDIEQPVENAVSSHIGEMQVLWVNVDDSPGPSSKRNYLEQNSIALLSNYGKTALDRASPTWLGWYSSRSQVHESGLWNIREVDRSYDPEFLVHLDKAVRCTSPP